MEYKSKNRIVWAAVAILLFFAYSYLFFFSVEPQGIFNSPDEMANAYFIDIYNDTGSLRVEDPLVGIAQGRVHPRSVTTQDGALVPGSFTGMIVLYSILDFFGDWNLFIIFTAIFSVLAVFAWRRIISEMFNFVAGDFAALVLAITPAWWYWTERGMYHNIFFTALLIFSGYFMFIHPVYEFLRRTVHVSRFYSLIDPLLAGAMLGFAWWVRTSEIFWTFIATVLLIVVFRKYLRAKWIITFFIAAIVAFLPALLINYQTYGSVFRIGYTVATNTGTSLLQTTGAGESLNVIFDYSKETLRTVRNFLLPFGLHPRTALTNFINYFILVPSWISILFISAIVWLFLKWWKGKIEKDEGTLFLLFIGVSIWLVAVYGSWVIHDNPDPEAMTVGISYSRYWLPMFVLASGIAGLGLAAFLKFLRPTIYAIPYFIIAALAILSFHTVFLTTGDGIVEIGNTLGEYSHIKKDVLQTVPKHGVIVVDRGDKVFFPDRRVIRGFREDENLNILRALSLRVPLYYYDVTIKEDDLNFQNKERLYPFGLKLEFVKTYTDTSLYKFTSTPRF